MLTQIKNGNLVKIEGILSEIDIAPKTFTKNNVEQQAIGGRIKIRVETVIKEVETVLEIPVELFATKLKNDGQPNPVYDSINKIMTEYVSIAASDYDKADRIRITGASLAMNEFYNPDGTFVSYPQIKASFVNKIKKEDCKPEATFNVVFVVGKAGYKTDAEGVEDTSVYEISGMIPQFGGKVDIVPFMAVNPGVIDAVSNYWSEGDTVRASGRLNFSSTVVETTVPVDFGEPITQKKTINVSELIVTGGSSTPLDGEYAINVEDIKAALVERKERLAVAKQKAEEKGKSGKAPAAPKKQFADLGF